jgi:hypothetical protein
MYSRSEISQWDSYGVSLFIIGIIVIITIGSNNICHYNLLNIL